MSAIRLLKLATHQGYKESVMAFDWLSDLGGVVSGASGVAALFGDDDEPRASVESEKALKEAIRLAKASADPNSGAFKNLVALEDEALRIGAVRQINDYLQQTQRSRARGGFSGFVNPERRDESIMKALAQSFQDAQQRARDTARTTLQNAAGSLTGAGYALSPVAQTQLTVENNNDRRRAGLGQAIGDSLGQVGRWMDDRFPESSPIPKPNTTPITLG